MDERFIIWGTPQFSVPALLSMSGQYNVTAVITRPDGPRGRGLHNDRSPVARSAEALRLPILKPEKLDQSFIDELTHYLPATFIVVAYGKILKESILRLSARPSLNIHPSLLPDLRGPSPIQATLLRGDSQTGVTIMQLDAEMDHGPILSQKVVPIHPQDTFQTLHDTLSTVGAELLIETLPSYGTSSLEPQQQDHSKATYCAFVNSNDGMLEITRDTAEECIRKIRALNPWPGTYIMFKGKRFKILQASASERHPVKTFSNDNGVLRLSCVQGSLEIESIQPDAKRPMDARAFLNGYARLLD